MAGYNLDGSPLHHRTKTEKRTKLSKKEYKEIIIKSEMCPHDSSVLCMPFWRQKEVFAALCWSDTVSHMWTSTFIVVAQKENNEDVNSTDRGTNSREASGNKILRRTYLASLLLITTTNPGLKSESNMTSDQKAGRPTCSVHWTVSMSSWYVISWNHRRGLSKYEQDYSRRGVGSISMINRLWADLFPQAILLPVSYSS